MMLNLCLEISMISSRGPPNLSFRETIRIPGIISDLNVTGCCVSLCDSEELGMQTCIPGLVLLVRIARQHGWLLKPCACIDHAVITLSSHLAANQNKGITCTYLGNQSGDRVIQSQCDM